jgi:hypothetical protein
MKRVVFGVVLTMLLVSMLASAVYVRPVKGDGETIYIRADGSIDPPTAPISTSDNISYALTGNIVSNNDGIVIERDNIILNGNGYWL